jgi:uncharacterized membrane protein
MLELGVISASPRNHTGRSMAHLQDLATPLIGVRPSALFLAFLAIHIAAGLTAVIAGAVAALSRKQRGRHPAFGTIYFRALLVVFVSSTVMAALRWSEDYHLFILGMIAFAAASVGYSARKIRWDGWPAYHILGMATSYIVLLTAFYVDNGPRLPLWNRLPNVAFWVLPALIGLPLVVGALRRHVRVLAVPRPAAGATGRGDDGSGF